MAAYTKLSIQTSEEQGDILIAYLSDFPFESFDYGGGMLNCYIPQPQFEGCSEEIEDMLHNQGILDFYFEEIEQQNWNAVWESNFSEVEVRGKIFIRAPFHKARPDYTGLEIVIQPKMSFGTGHHHTTQLMIESLLDSDIKDKQVLDMGSGTGVLAIVAAKLGAESVYAVEIDDMAEESVRENIALNNVGAKVDSVCGDARAIEGKSFDIVLANINRNVLLADMRAYSATLTRGGILVISGFLEEDIKPLARRAKTLGFKLIQQRELDIWQVLKFEKVRQ